MPPIETGGRPESSPPALGRHAGEVSSAAAAGGGRVGRSRSTGRVPQSPIWQRPAERRDGRGGEAESQMSDPHTIMSVQSGRQPPSRRPAKGKTGRWSTSSDGTLDLCMATRPTSAYRS